MDYRGPIMLFLILCCTLFTRSDVKRGNNEVKMCKTNPSEQRLQMVLNTAFQTEGEHRFSSTDIETNMFLNIKEY